MSNLYYDKLRTIYLNNQGDLCIKLGEFQKAVDCLMEALELCAIRIHDESVDDNGDRDEQCIARDRCSEFVSFVERCLVSHSPNRVDSTEESHQLPIDIVMPTRNPNEEPHCCDDAYLHKCPIHIPWYDISLPSFQSLSTVVIFNFALALQLGAMEGLNLEQDPTQCHAELQRAIRLYAMGEALLADKRNHLISTRLALAILNNTGHAYQVLHETESASAYW
jgi:hypothetical protein